MRFRNPAGRLTGRVLLLGGVLTMAACGGDGPAEPVDIGGDVVGSWTAISFSGQPMPIEEVIIDPDRGTCLKTLEDVVLSFLPNGTYNWQEEVQLECDVGQPETTNNTFTGTYRVENTRLFMADSEAPDEELESGFSVEEQTLTMRQRFGNITLTSIFQRTTI